MNTNESTLAPDVSADPAAQSAEAPRPSVGTRLLSLGMLTVTAATFAWFAWAGVQVFSDSWIAPISLTPDSDAVLRLNLELTRQRAEIGRVEAEVARFDAEIAAIDAGILRLHTLRDRGRAMFEYGADLSGTEASTLARQITQLREERVILERLIERQTAEAERARANLDAGLIERRDLEREEQGLDNLLLRRVANERARTELEARRREASAVEGEFRSELARSSRDARMPEIVAREEADVRLEVEVLRLEAERRGLVALREVGRRSLEELTDVMHQIEARPAYRATREEMDVAFVPYEQLEGVAPGARIIQCELGIFMCHDVGEVAEVLSGEVVTQDPWGELARGRYAVLALSDASAVEERILRVR